MSIEANEMTEIGFHNAQSFCKDLISSLKSAKKTIDLNTYIFRDDELGNEIFNELLKASKKGVKCRLIVDGFGSKEWIGKIDNTVLNDNIEIRIYHPLPFFSWLSIYTFFRHFYSFFSRINRRDHKKLCIIDEEFVYLGSINITTISYQQRESGVKVNYAINDCQHYFNLTWEKSNKFKNLQKFNFKFTKPYTKTIKSPWIRNNFNRASRQFYNEQFFSSIKNAHDKVWLVTPYFLPTQQFMASLKIAAKNGADIKILLPSNPDIITMKYVAHHFYPKLLEAGVEIYEYQKEMIHAKISFIDDQIIVGSSNFDRRSLFTNLEIDIFLQKEETKKDFIEQFQNDLLVSSKILESPRYPGLWASATARMLIFMESA